MTLVDLDPIGTTTHMIDEGGRDSVATPLLPPHGDSKRKSGGCQRLSGDNV